jgi:Cell wall hydrolyses involved in spore germination
LVNGNLQKYAYLIFLALTIWREARGESYLCKLAVAYSILNRVKRPSWWGTNIMEVLFKKWQYSSLTDPKDKQLTTWPRPDSVWWECVNAAQDAMNEEIENPVEGADSYFDVSISNPYWTTAARFVTQIDRIKFYDTDHDYEMSDAKD